MSVAIASQLKLPFLLQHMLGLIDDTSLTCQQKHHIFKQGVCPRLTWSLLVEDLHITWLERELQPMATKALKKWAGSARSSNTSILFLVMKRGGLALATLSGKPIQKASGDLNVAASHIQ